MKVLTIGSGMNDIFLEHDNLQTITLTIDECDVDFIILEEGRKIELAGIHKATGGGSTNAASSFIKLGIPVAVCCKLGTDTAADFIMKELKKRKIDCSFICQTADRATGSSYIIPSPTGNSALLVDRGANLTLAQEDLPLKQLSAFTHLYITSLSQHTSKLLPIITKAAHAAGLFIATNPGTSQLCDNVATLIDSLPFIHTLIMNCFEATLLMEHVGFTSKNKKHPNPKKNMPPLLASLIKQGTTSFLLEDYFKEVHAQGIKIAIVTNGSDGIYASDGTTIYYHPSLPIDVVSTVGAGDAFASTFVAQQMKGKSIEDSIRAAIINCAAILEHSDATTGLCSQTDLDEMMHDIDKRGIKKFPLV